VKRTEVLLPAPVLREMEGEAERHDPDETGGVLLGYLDRDDPRRVQVMLQIGPGPKAIHGPHRFEPDAGWQEAQIGAAYAESGRIATYLGDWHSHPQGSTAPSRLDRSTARRIARCRQARVRHPLILILCGDPEEWRIAVYRRRRWRLREGKVIVAEAT
jgi:integrative and conjugative element protein (TIGR02256 family)